MKGAIYARESSGDSKNAPSISGQIEIGKKLISDLNHEFVDVYADEGYSGGDWGRPELAELKKDAEAGMFEFVWVWSQDRLARDTEMFRNIYRFLKEKNVTIFNGTHFEQISLETTGDMAKHTVMALGDEMFRKNTSDKVKAAYRHRKEIAEKTNTVLKWGRNPVPKEMKELALKLRSEHPDWGVRKIAAELPPYPLILKQGETEPRMGKVSYGWVYSLFNNKE